MSYGANPVLDADRHAERQWSTQDRANADEQRLHDLFIRRCKQGMTDLDMLNEALDYGDGPSTADALRLLVDASNGADVRERAATLIDRMAWKYADMNVGSP